MRLYIKEKRYAIVAFIMCCIILLVYATVKNINTYYWDSEYYFGIADSVLSSGSFRITDFPDTYRGYLLPVLILLFKSMFRGVWGWRILISVILSAGMSFVFPYILDDKGIDTFAKLMRLIPVMVAVIFFWGDFLQYPLSDIPSIIFLGAGTALLISLIRKNELSILSSVIRSLSAGIMMYAAYNTRAAFLYGILPVLVIFVFFMRKIPVKTIICLLCMLIGISSVALPQCLINRKYLGRFTPSINTNKYTEEFYDYSQDLMTQQVYWGLLYDRFEGYIGDLNEFPDNAVYYDDHVGASIIEQEGLDETIFKLSDFFRLYVKYPVDMTGIYIRHLVSLMTPVYNEQYITDMYGSKALTVGVSMIIWLLTGISICNTIARKNLTCSALWVIALIIPSLLQLLGAPEIRFFIPLYLLAYTYVFVMIDYRSLYSDIKERIWGVVIVSGIVALLWLAIIGDIMSNCNSRTILVGGCRTEHTSLICENNVVKYGNSDFEIVLSRRGRCFEGFEVGKLQTERG